MISCLSMARRADAVHGNLDRPLARDEVLEGLRSDLREAVSGNDRYRARHSSGERFRDPEQESRRKSTVS